MGIAEYGENGQVTVSKAFAYLSSEPRSFDPQQKCFC